jgi:hypothetical protein
MNKKSLFSCIIVSAILLLTGCNPPVQPTISIAPTSITLNLDETYALQVTITPDNVNTPITWESTNMDVATVDTEGVVTAKEAGTTTIIATIADAEPAECVVTVVDNAIVMLTDTLELFVDDTYQLIAKLPACDTTAQLIWTSETPEVANVDENGLVTVKAEGTAIITASAEGLKSAQCIIVATQIQSSFPRKYLIEHFTGDQCGYCPSGMFSMVEYIQQTSTPCIWVSHHYGYNQDEYTIPESAKIASACGVSGAPNMAMNRTKITGTAIAFHPGFLVEDGMAETIADKCDTTAEASVMIDHTYDAATKQLHVTVSGLVANTNVEEYLLTVIIKENGLIGKQADYYYSWKEKGYKEFMHPCVARDVISTSQLGDTVKVTNHRYSQSYTYTIADKWVPENCCVVAYITPLNKKPVINAEETPLVAGTTGGAEYLPFAITEAKEPTNATKLSFTEVELNKPSNDKLNVKLIASKSTRSDFYGPLKMVINLEFNTPDSTLPVGTYEFAEGNELNTFSAGTVDYATKTFGASLMQYCKSADLTSVCHTWRIKSGSVTVNEDGSIVAEGKMDNGKNFAFTYTPAQ